MDMARNLSARDRHGQHGVPNIPIGNPYQSTPRGYYRLLQLEWLLLTRGRHVVSCGLQQSHAVYYGVDRKRPAAIDGIHTPRSGLYRERRPQVATSASGLQRAAIPRTGRATPRRRYNAHLGPASVCWKAEWTKATPPTKVLSTKLTQRFTRGLMYMLSYTLVEIHRQWQCGTRIEQR